MADKSILKERFKKSLNTYNENAIVQKQMAQELLNLIPLKNYNNILELGCGSGILTNLAINRFKYNTYLAGDIVEECSQYIREDFFVCDIDNFNPKNKYDLIISNAAMQWCEDIDKTVKVLMNALNDDGILAFSTFGKENMFEIREIFNIGLNYYSLDELKEKFKKYNIIELKDNVKTIEFKSIKEILKHIKMTGVNAFSPIKIAPKKLASLMKDYDKKFGNKLTYHPILVVLKNN
ncbi:malonyl-ACP O-methyltransferase BioC [bacterium]|nr:malonyl-ACP O-methyltransferase BioC [bacterium]